MSHPVITCLAVTISMQSSVHAIVISHDLSINLDKFVYGCLISAMRQNLRVLIIFQLVKIKRVSLVEQIVDGNTAC